VIRPAETPRVPAYIVTQRTREFGIRLALGAEGGAVLHMVLGHGEKLVAIGLSIGIGGASGALMSTT
jgi:hypothetical protein